MGKTQDYQGSSRKYDYFNNGESTKIKLFSFHFYGYYEIIVHLLLKKVIRAYYKYVYNDCYFRNRYLSAR